MSGMILSSTTYNDEYIYTYCGMYYTVFAMIIEIKNFVKNLSTNPFITTHAQKLYTNIITIIIIIAQTLYNN